MRNLGVNDMWDYKDKFEEMNVTPIKVRNRFINNESIKGYIN